MIAHESLVMDLIIPKNKSENSSAFKLANLLNQTTLKSIHPPL